MFHVATTVNRRTVMKPGASILSEMVKNVRNSPAPSIRAASRTSVGTDSIA
ncbi:hypothetical protein D3C85_1912450 [compost metagenome]